MDALTVELAYRDILSIDHTEGLDYQQSAKRYAMIIMMALNVLREAKDTSTTGRYVFFILLDHEWNS